MVRKEDHVHSSAASDHLSCGSFGGTWNGSVAGVSSYLVNSRADGLPAGIARIGCTLLLSDAYDLPVPGRFIPPGPFLQSLYSVVLHPHSQGAPSCWALKTLRFFNTVTCQCQCSDFVVVTLVLFGFVSAF